MSYSTAAWRHLGRRVKDARKGKGLRETTDWAVAVGRSGRTLLGLERGEPVGDETLELIEQALGWVAGEAHRILMDASAAGGRNVGATVEAEGHVTRPGENDLSKKPMEQLRLEIDERLSEMARRAAAQNPDVS